MVLLKYFVHMIFWSWRDSFSLCPFLMDNYLLPLLFKRFLQLIKDGGNHWSGTLLTLRKSFNPFSIFPKHGYVSLFTLTSFIFLFILWVFFLLPSNVSFFKFPFGLDQPAINHIFPVGKSMGIDVFTLYTSCKKNFLNGFFSCFVWYRIYVANGLFFYNWKI